MLTAVQIFRVWCHECCDVSVVLSCGHAVRSSSLASKNSTEGTAASTSLYNVANRPVEQGSKGHKSALLHSRYDSHMIAQCSCDLLGI